jgi:hypothetical protein
LRYIGPGLLVTVGFIDPGNLASNLAAGVNFGYSLLCIITLSTFSFRFTIPIGEGDGELQKFTVDENFVVCCRSYLNSFKWNDVYQCHFFDRIGIFLFSTDEFDISI